MPIEPDPLVERLRTQLKVLQAWVADLSAENAALREQLAGCDTLSADLARPRDTQSSHRAA